MTFDIFWKKNIVPQKRKSRRPSVSGRSVGNAESSSAKRNSNIDFFGSTDQDSDQDSDQDDFAKRLLKAIGNESLSAMEIMKRLKLSHRPTFRKNYLDPALEKGLIERTIPDKHNSKNQKYRKKRES